MGVVDTVEWACVLCGCRIQNDCSVEQRICIRFCVKLEHSSTDDSEGHSCGQLVMGSFIMTTHSLMHCVLCRNFWRNITSPRWLSPDLALCNFWLFPKIKWLLKREEISDHWWDSGKYNGAADGDLENCVRSQSAYFEGDWGVIVLCTMFLVSSSINVSIFHITWLDTFWTDLVYFLIFCMLDDLSFAASLTGGDCPSQG